MVCACVLRVVGSCMDGIKKAVTRGGSRLSGLVALVDTSTVLILAKKGEEVKMKNNELHDLCDLVTAANYFFEKNDIAASVRMIVGRFDNEIHIFELKDGVSKARLYHSSRFIDLDISEFDPKLIKAQAHIKRLLEVDT